METIEYMEPASDLATAGLAPTRTKGPGALESLVEVMLRVDELAVSDPGGVDPVTCSAIFPEVWGTLRARAPERCCYACCVIINRRTMN